MFGFEFQKIKISTTKRSINSLIYTFYETVIKKTILSPHILSNINKAINNEADIYKEVKWILGLYYPTCRSKNKASFIQGFKSYEPDILIPELKVAIEYKYLKSKKDNIDEYLDQIKVDSTNYTGDNRYDKFIAVCCIGNAGIATSDSIEEAWKAKKFPSNWELIIVTIQPEITH